LPGKDGAGVGGGHHAVAADDVGDKGIKGDVGSGGDATGAGGNDEKVADGGAGEKLAVLIDVPGLDVFVDSIGRIIVGVGDPVALGGLDDDLAEEPIRVTRHLPGLQYVQNLMELAGTGHRGGVGRVLGVAPGEIAVAAIDGEGREREQADKGEGQDDSGLTRFVLLVEFHFDLQIGWTRTSYPR
jgi:hypothetical protein